MKKLIFLFSFLFVSSQVFAGSYNYISQKDFKTWLETDKPVLICDIQNKKPFKKHHFKNAVETNAYPAKNQKQLNRLEKVIESYNKTGDKIVIVCPRGGGGAKRTYDHLLSRNIPEDKLLILKKGAAGWPYDEFIEGTK